ncbi:TonB family protein [Spirosoma fluviale]|uniref:Outer membrane transport energization protein TonB n=1 Tax=Spirosoma fluviale TaxID=1597977 RepID=A0A286FZM3_9BACT|nr:TonB family protein [Spirosoma fluviale]SOD88658.1 outer membrane transport energization protein TonB [Spirosoma fluviale]
MNALDYLLKANLYGLLFASCYWLLLRRHTFFGLNRAYLLASLVLSLTLPLVRLPAETVETLPMPVGVIALPVTTIQVATLEAPQAEPSPDWEQLALWGYGLIALALLTRLGIRTGRLLRLIHWSPRQTQDGYILVQPNDPTLPTFSFFNYIILNPADTDNTLILRHELVHVRQWHSADVLGLGIVQAVFWACPALLLIARLLRQVHEFLADQPATQPTEYARFLVAYSFGTQLSVSSPDPLTNSFFNPSLLKQRIIMLQQKATTRWALGKYVLVLPLAFGLLAMTTAREEITAVVDSLQDEGITVTGKVTSSVDGKPLPGAIVVVAETGKGIPTDTQGQFTLKNVPKTATISFSFVGFSTTNVPQVGEKGRTTLNIALSPTDPNELPTMGATAAYKAIKPNPSMPVRTPPSSETINGKVYRAVEEPAVFPTGIPGLMQYVAHALRYPAKAKAAGVEGNVLVQFVVLPTGAIGSASIKKGIGSGCDEEALRVVKQMPRWIPGQQNGKTVATQYVLPIQFALEKKTDDKRTGQVSGNQLNDVHVIGYEPASTPTPQKQISQTGDEIFTVVEKVPEFPGGIRALYQYLARNLRYPTEARQNKIQGRVYVKFIVDKTGDIRELRVLKGIGGGCDEEAIRVVSQMPNWIPGKQQGKAVSVMYNLPIQFSLEKKTEDKRTGQVTPDSKAGSVQTLDNIVNTNKPGSFELDKGMSGGSKNRYAMPLPDSLRKPGTSFTIRSNRFMTGEPLIIIDGVEAKSGISHLNPDDIDNVTVLKGESATVYGEKGKNGVILVTTKKK